MQFRYVEEEGANTILERATALSLGEIPSGHPAVLSCGGIFVPRPRPLNPLDPLYHILNTPNDTRPTKIVSAIISRNVLDEVINRERQN